MRMEEQIVSSASGEYTRRVWRLEGAKDEPLCVFLDAEFYLDRMDVAAILPGLTSATCLFVSHVDGATRHPDYTCNPRYAEFIVNDVLGAFDGKDGHLICGLSLSGLAAAHMALIYPEIFPRAICQSGSFWWNDEWLTANIPPTQGKFWISVGDQETEAGISHPPTGLRQDVSQIDGARRVAEALREQGADVKFQPYSGGHDFTGWLKELPQAMMWISGSTR